MPVQNKFCVYNFDFNLLYAVIDYFKFWYVVHHSLQKKRSLAISYLFCVSLELLVIVRKEHVEKFALTDISI